MKARFTQPRVNNRFRTAGRSVRARKMPAAVQLGRIGGRKGGPARARILPAGKKTSIATHAANVRWGNKTSYTKPPFYRRKVR